MGSGLECMNTAILIDITKYPKLDFIYKIAHNSLMV